jgi:hypothetical protein
VAGIPMRLSAPESLANIQRRRVRCAHAVMSAGKFSTTSIASSRVDNAPVASRACAGAALQGWQGRHQTASCWLVPARGTAAPPLSDQDGCR